MKTINAIRLLIPAIISLVVGLPFVSCKRHNNLTDQMLDRIESLAEEQSDSALIELNRFDNMLASGMVRLDGETQHTRYVLLKTQIHNKDSIDAIQQTYKTMSTIFRYRQYHYWSLFGAVILIILLLAGVNRKEVQFTLDSYVENISSLQDRIDQINKEHLVIEAEHHRQIKNLFAKGFEELDALCTEYYNCQGQIGEQRIIFKKVCKLINDFSTEPKQKKLESLIDENYNHAMEKVKAPEIGLSEEELQLFRYKVAGFTIRSICLLMQRDSIDATKKRIQRLKQKIIQSESPYRDEIAALM